MDLQGHTHTPRDLDPCSSTWTLTCPFANTQQTQALRPFLGCVFAKGSHTERAWPKYHRRNTGNRLKKESAARKGRQHRYGPSTLQLLIFLPMSSKGSPLPTLSFVFTTSSSRAQGAPNTRAIWTYLSPDEATEMLRATSGCCQHGWRSVTYSLLPKPCPQTPQWHPGRTELTPHTPSPPQCWQQCCRWVIKTRDFQNMVLGRNYEDT